jgi:hypothetical protein
MYNMGLDINDLAEVGADENITMDLRYGINSKQFGTMC